MKVKQENKQNFLDAMFNIVRAIKNETENCCTLCGGVNEKELLVIVFVGDNNNVKMSDIADNIEAPMSTLTNVVDKLVEKKLINRDHSGEDRRVINVSLTSAGKEAYNSVAAKKARVADRLLSSLNEKEQVLLIKNLKELAAAIANPK